MTRCLERSASLPFSAARRFPLSPWSSLLPRPQLSLQAPPVWPWWRRDTSASQLPEPTFISISTVEARPTGLTNSGTAVSSQRCSCRRSTSRADSVAEARPTMRVFYNAPLRRQALVLSALAAQEIKRQLHQPRRMSLLPLALVEHLVAGCVAQHARDRRGRSAPRWSALCGKTPYCFSLSLAERHQAAGPTFDVGLPCTVVTKEMTKNHAEQQQHTDVCPICGCFIT